MIKIIKNIGLLFSLGILAFSCANIVKPSGGPKDLTPPQVEESSPENFTKNFNANRIVVKFDEFIQLKNVNQTLIISPSLPEKPKILAKGKNLIIDINNELEDSTTYAFNFGNSIVDITEGNSQDEYRYVFSTGNYIDSLIIAGSIINSFDLKEEKEVFVMLYNLNTDSVPLNEQPRYIAKTNKTGEFILSNLKSGEYKIFALKDANNNYRFDMPNEKIAFLDTLIIPYAEYFEKIDTIRLDTNALDSVNTDSIVDNSYTIFYPRDIVMHLFEEYHSDQHIIGSSREERAKCLFEFNEPVKDSLIIEPYSFTIDKQNLIFEFSKARDSVVCWLKDSTVYKLDTLDFLAKYYRLDSMEQLYMQTDTLSLRYRPPKKNKKGEAEKPDTILVVHASVPNGKVIDLNKDYIFSFDAPLNIFDTSKVKLFEVIDSLESQVEYQWFQDSLSIKKYHIKYQWDELKSYKIYIYDKAFGDIYNRYNDTIISVFSVEKAESYGAILFNVKNVHENAIIQFLNSKNVVLKEFFISEECKLNIPYLLPGKYSIKIIFDQNANKVWDPGNYIKHIQPERVMFNKEEINVRANWDLELDLDLFY